MKVKTNGIELNCTIEGEGPWLVMSHSLACDWGMWDEQAGALAARYKVLRYDMRGHGASDAPPGRYSFDMLAQDLHGLLQALGIARCHWVGLSMGGMIGQVYALKYPGVFQTLVLADTSSRYGPEVRPVWEDRIKTALEQGMEPLVQPTLERWFTEPYRKAHPRTMERVARMIRNTPPAGYAGCCAAIPDLDMTARLKAISCPTLILVGEQDTGTPVSAAREIHEAIAGAQLTIIPSAAHLSNIEQAEVFTSAVLAFLQKHT
jgi:3-oxoadipate enol-lactonase